MIWLIVQMLDLWTRKSFNIHLNNFEFESVVSSMIIINLHEIIS